MHSVQNAALVTMGKRLASSSIPGVVAQAVDGGAFTVERFVEALPVLVEAPGGPEKLKALVLEAAVRGRLSRRAAHDSLVEQDLAGISRQRAQQATSRRAQSPESTVPQLHGPFEIPEHWRWVRWGDLVLSTDSGWSPQCENRPRSDGEWGVLKVSAVSWIQFNPDENKALPQGVQPREECAAHAGDFLMSRANTAELVGRSVIVETEPVRLLLSDKLVRCRFSEFTEQQYVNLYNRTGTARAHYVENASGTSDSMKNISRGVILSMLVSLPPLAEQKRIVARVDQLMALIDELEAKHTRKREVGAQFTKASLEALTIAEGPDEFDAAWQRVAANFSDVISDAVKVKDLRATILNLAFQGRLVARDSKDEPAPDYLQRVLKVDPRCMRPSDLVPGWAACALADAFEIGTGSTPTRTDSSYWTGGTIPWVTSTATSADTITSGNDYVTEKALKDFRLRRFMKGSLVVALYGQGKTRGQVARLAIDACVNQACAVIRIPESEPILQEFVWLHFRKQYDAIRELAEGGAQPNLNVGKIKDSEISFPPRQEMKRIVAKVEQLMKLCDELEAKLRRAEDRAAKLVEAVVQELVV